MLRKSLLSVWVLFVLFLSPLGAQAFSVKETLHPQVIDLKMSYYLKVSADGRFWFLYGDEENRLWLEDFSRGKRYLVNENPRGRASTANLALNEEKIFVIWREKGLDGKVLYLRAFDLKKNTWSPPVELDRASAPLGRNEIQALGERVFVVWYGEAQNHYGLYATYSLDGGKTFAKARELTTEGYSSLYPSLFLSPEGALVLGEEHQGAERRMMAYIWKNGKWVREEVGPCGVVSIFLKPFWLEQGLGGVWFHFAPGDSHPQTVWAYRAQDSWRTGIFEELDKKDLSAMQLVADSSCLVLALSGVKWFPSGKKSKNNLWVYLSEDGGQSWQGPFKVRTYPYENTHAKNPQLAFSGEKVLVAWEDYRFIRSNVCFNYSLDGGKTWQAEDICLPRPGFHNSRLNWFRNNLLYYKGKFYLLGHRFESDALAKPHLLFVEIKL